MATKRGAVRARLSFVVLVAALATAAPAFAAFPYGTPSSPGARDWKLPAGAGNQPNEYPNVAFKFAATPEPGNELVNANEYELNGIRGPSTVDSADVDVAWRTTTGRPEVTIATLDSGIKWNDAGAMSDLRKKTRINKGEAPKPNRGRTVSLEPGVVCATDFEDPSTTPASDYDLNNDGVFNVVDYACDTRVERDPAARAAAGKPRGVGPAEMLDPQDVLIAFTNGSDGDRNGFRDDMVGWDFLDDDNDPYDDVQYGHGTGEAEDGFGEADNGRAMSHCPNCMGIHMRVGDSFIADVNDFAQAVIYAVDNDVLVVQEALGTLNHSKLGLDAVEYAYDHGVTVVASAADEAAQHHNWPSSYPHVLMVNSVTRNSSAPPGQRSYVQFNGCTNFMANVTLAIPSTSCSSDAVGQSSGQVGLIYSAALNAHERSTDPLEAHPTCRRVDGRACVISANEVRQVMASGTVDAVSGADDVDFLSTPKGGAEPSCNPPVPGCTDPNNPVILTPIALHRPIAQPFLPPNTRSYPARKGHDQFYGYGRVNTNKSVDRVDAKLLPPEVEIRKPVNWWDQIDPGQASFPLEADIANRGGTYTCEVFVAPGSYPNNDTGAAGDFKKVESTWCDGSTARGPLRGGKIADVPLAQLKALFPANAQGWGDREPGKGTEQTSNGRPNTEPYGFVVKVVARTTSDGRTLTGEDRRNEYLHRDQDMLDGFPKKLPADGAASPLFTDLDGDNRNEMVMATSDGDVHAYRRDGSELEGWPVRSDPLPIHQGRRSFSARGAIIASPAAGDLDRDGLPEIVAADFEGKVYAWNAEGELVFKRETRPEYSGAPLTPFADVRRGKKYRTQHGFIASPVVVDLDRDDGGKQEIVAAAMDRHVYAWNHDESEVDGYPVLVVDYSKLLADRADEETHAPNFRPDVGDLNQGAIVDTPAVGDIAGDERPEIVVGTNEEYRPGTGGEPPADFNQTSSYSAVASLLDPANTRLYAIKPEGDPGGPNGGDSPFVAGWPTRLAHLKAEILPVVGEGVTGAPVIAPVKCAFGGEGPKVGASAAIGPAYVLNADGSSCYGDEDGRKRPLDTEASSSVRVTDKPSIPAFGHGAFASLDGAAMSFFTPAAGAMRALDAAAGEYQIGGQDQLSGWVADGTGEFRPNFPVQMNDLQFLTGPSVADMDGLPGEEIVAGSASLDLQAYNAAGLPLNAKWPKLTSDWMVANPLIGSFGTLDTEDGARKVVMAITRSGFVYGYGIEAPSCSPGAWPRFHHDNANSGDTRRDAGLPGRPMDPAAAASRLTVKAPGDDLLCGKADAYEVVTSDDPIDESNFGSATPVPTTVEPGEPGGTDTIPLPAGVKRFVAVRAVDEQGNIGRVAAVDREAPAGSPGNPGAPANPGAPGNPGAGNPGGGGNGMGGRVGNQPIDSVRPVISRLRLLATRFAIGRTRTAVSARARRGTRIRFSLSERARVRIQVQKPRGRSWRTAATLRRQARAGRNEIRFSGRIGRKPLRRGRYRLRLVATDAAGNASAAKAVRLRIVKR